MNEWWTSINDKVKKNEKNIFINKYELFCGSEEKGNKIYFYERVIKKLKTYN